MNSIAKILLVLAAAAFSSVASGFAPTFVGQQRPGSELSMFGFGGKKKAAPQESGGVDADVFGGKGKKITVREDEDNDM